MASRWGIIIGLLVEGSRDKRDADWCRKWSIGFARRRLGSPVRSVGELQEDFEERVAAANELRDICRACGDCEMARK